MSYTYLSLDTSLIPQETKDYVPTYPLGYFSNDGSRLMICGYNSSGELVQDSDLLLQWLQWESDPEATKNLIIDSAIEYTLEELNTMKFDIDSIWYLEPEVEG